MTYDEWAAALPPAVTSDLLWRVQVFRLATFLGACAEQDTRSLAKDGRFVQTSAQLCRAAGSIAANIAEGYPRASARDRVRYYEYALGSAAEVKAWYLQCRMPLGDHVIAERFALLGSITRLLVTMVRSSRERPLKPDHFTSPDSERVP